MMKDASKADLQALQIVLSRNLADEPGHPSILKTIVGAMDANKMPRPFWTIYVNWMRDRMAALYEADGTVITTGEVVASVKEWLKAVEALLK